MFPNLLNQQASKIPKLYDIFATPSFLKLRNLSVTKNKCHECQKVNIGVNFEDVNGDLKL